MTIQEIRDRFYADWKRCHDALLAESSDVFHTVCRVDETAVIRKEMEGACAILRVRAEHFERLAQEAQ